LKRETLVSRLQEVQDRKESYESGPEFNLYEAFCENLFQIPHYCAFYSLDTKQKYSKEIS